MKLEWTIMECKLRWAGGARRIEKIISKLKFGCAKKKKKQQPQSCWHVHAVATRTLAPRRSFSQCCFFYKKQRHLRPFPVLFSGCNKPMFLTSNRAVVTGEM
jgi:hypothetical protein